MEHLRPEGGGDGHPTPERHEDVRISAIVIPADEQIPLRQDRIVTSNLDDYQRLVGGHLEILTFESPPATMYLNSEGKNLELPVNRRATMLLWAHDQRFRYLDYIAGDAFLVGPVDAHGDDTGVSDEFVHRLLEARHFRVEVQTRGDPQWYGNELRFDDWTEAYGYVLELGRRWTQVEDLRIVPEA